MICSGFSVPRISPTTLALSTGPSVTRFWTFIFRRTRFAAIEIAFELFLIFGGHADDGNFVIGVKAERAGVRQVHARGFSAALSADDGDRAGLVSSFQKTAKLSESTHAVCRRRRLFER